MNPVFVILVLLGVIILWFLLSFAFRPFGRFIYQIWKDAIDEMNKEDKEEKEREN